MDIGRHASARRDPLFVGLELDAELVVEDPQIAVAATDDGVGHHLLHFLRHYADVGAVAAVIAEAIIAKAVGEMAEEDDIMLQRDVGSAPAAAASAAAAAEAATATTTETTTAAATEATAATTEPAAAETATAYARVPARRLETGGSTGTDIRECIGATSRRGTRAARA